MLLRCVVLVTILLLAASACWSDCSDMDSRVVLQFEKPYVGYSAVCTIDGGPVRIAVVKGKSVVRRFTLKTVTQPHGMKPVRLRSGGGPDVQGLFVECCGGSALHDYVFEVGPRPGGTRQLMYNLDKGGVDYGYDAEGRLRGMRFRYCRWHVDSQRVDLGGHVFTAIDYRWLPERRTFRRGNVHVDKEMEEQASLLDILRAIGSDHYLPVAYVSDKDYNRVEYYYRPVGILRDKTPVELRDATKVKVTISYEKRPSPYGDEPRMASITRAETD